jgi:L-rhamnose mutarotase
MKRFGFVLKVRHDRLEEYKKQHMNVWPEMKAAWSEAGWHHYKLFLREDGLVFGYFETEGSLQTEQAKMATKDVNTRWQTSMAPFTDTEARPDESFVELEEVFHLE